MYRICASYVEATAEAKKKRPAAAAYCPKRCFKTEASGDEKREAADLTCCSSAQGTIFELAAFVAATTETAVRGFSLGFGYVLVKATLEHALFLAKVPNKVQSQPLFFAITTTTTHHYHTSLYDEEA